MKTMFIKNAFCERERIELEESQVTEMVPNVNLGRTMNMRSKFIEELDRRRAAWAAFGPPRETTYQLADPDILTSTTTIH
ncbi:hypothetical protein ANCDUO_17355 [Ancylostoma duodenale]|uniref:Uncharacterized protein n=1 Tax=Ancylostoma duodenale TaxID=51022 RepID=A0A0C2G0X4_9BILA|nr:hypothetical protein ANCDUO_17355 [Ancylostoma duodenale]